MGATIQAGNVQFLMSLKDLISQELSKAGANSDKLEKKLGGVESAVNKIGKTAVLAFAAFEIKQFASEILETGRVVDGLNSSLKFSEGSVTAANQRFDYLVETSKRLGLELEGAAHGYVTISAAAKGTALEGRGAQEAFEGVSTAASVMHLSSDQTQGALLALSQMISKGKVQAEELRGQLGERIPGAFQIAARAMGMTTKELDKFMSDGKLIAEDFLPAFSAQLKKEFGDNIPSEMESSVIAANNLKTEMFLFKKEIYEGLQPAIIGVTLALRDMAKMGIEGVKWVKEHHTGIEAFGIALGVVSAAVLLYNTRLFLMNTYTAIQNGLAFVSIWRTYGLAAALDVCNIALFTTEVLLGNVVVVVAAIAAGLYYAYQKSEDFRAGMDGIWEAAKYVFEKIGNFFKKIFSPIFEAIAAFKEGRYADAAIAVGKIGLGLALAPAAIALSAPIGAAGLISEREGIADAYKKGVYDSHRKTITDKMEESHEELKATNGSFTKGMPNNPYATTPTDKTKGTSSHGGGHPTQIIVTIQELGNNIVINSNSLKEGASEIKKIVQKALVEAVNDFQANIVTN